ncbi:sigma-70 family RNA polymerase sigma factor [Candidatus Frankia nodulisporulans]|uniref:sigma-70 family RNA polymerase sigma factor n=1 Tax=Candidatus Frankia nodulisporulans TaxID=2060052 RepID=UPI0013CF5DA6|nr:sigma-70 family RNA polymerase sigma factor [Candidatus Frankia nodulisporulans]
MTRPGLLAAPGSPDDDPPGHHGLAQPVPAVRRPGETITSAEDTADETLAVWAAAGDAVAFAELYQRYQQMTGAHLRRRGVDPADVDDLVQEVFASALELLHDGVFSGALFRHWLFAHVLTRIVNRHFQNGWQHDEPLTWVTFTAALPDPDAAPPPTLSVRLATALATLSPWHRQIIELRYVEGQSIATTALITGLAEYTVTALTGQAKRDLHQALTGLAQHRTGGAA